MEEVRPWWVNSDPDHPANKLPVGPPLNPDHIGEVVAWYVNSPPKEDV